MTPAENHLRRRAGGAGYSGGFLEHYVLPVLYPEQLTERTGLVLASLVLVVNVAVYSVVYRRVRRSPSKPGHAPS